MKKPPPRELLWMTLPAVLLGGTAWWLSSGGQMSARLPNVRTLVTNARRPSLSIQKLMVFWTSPTQIALGENQVCHISALVDASASLGQVRPSQAPSFTTTDVLDDKRRSLAALLLGRKGRGVSPLSFSRGASWDTVSGQSVPNTTYTVYAEIPTQRLPPATQGATFTGIMTWGTARPRPVKCEVVLPWMQRPAKRLQIKSVTCKSSQFSPHSDIRVEVVCRILQPRNPSVYGDYPSLTSVMNGGIGIGYNPQEERWRKSNSGDDVILAEWSQRLESGNGRLNSLHLLQKHMAREIPKSIKLRNGYAASELARTFDALCTLFKVRIQNDMAHLTYSINSIPPTFKNPVFCCEIYLVGDGRVNVRLPLTKPIKESR